jgi:hypothetical protein
VYNTVPGPIYIIIFFILIVLFSQVVSKQVLRHTRTYFRIMTQYVQCYILYKHATVHLVGSAENYVICSAPLYVKPICILAVLVEKRCCIALLFSPL